MTDAYLERMVSDISEDSVASDTYTRPGCARMVLDALCHCASPPAPIDVVQKIDPPNQSANDDDAHPIPISITQSMIDTIRMVQTLHHRVTLQSSLPQKCLTRPVPQRVLDRLPRDYTVVAPLTVGGMSRLFVVTKNGRHCIMKITDMSRSLGGCEMTAYTLLGRHGIPVPSIQYHGIVHPYHVIIIERLECSLTTLFLAATVDASFLTLAPPIIAGVDAILHRLRRRGLVVVDFTSNNIMCRLTPDRRLELVVIDPQFLVTIDALGARIGKEYATVVDRVHFCFKVLAMSRLRVNSDLYVYAKRVCKALLGFVPTTADIVHVLAVWMPRVIRTADVIHKK